MERPSVDSPSQAEPTYLVEAPPRRRGWVLPVVVAVSVLVGTLTSVIMFSGWSEPEHRYLVSIYLDRAITAEQQAALQSALAGLDPVEAVRYESREQAFQKFQSQFKDSPELAASITVEEIPALLLADVAAPEFDCAMLRPIRDMAGVDTVVVYRMPGGDGIESLLSCGDLL
ncbi:permease-like cell division protein FtsX [Catellatospora coxensis]